VTATVHVGDALTVLRSLPADSVDAIITDPPYCAGAVSEASRSAAKGQGLRSGNIKRFGWFVGDNMGTAGLAFLLRDVAFEAVRVVKPTGSLLVFCDWRMVATLQPAIESAGVRSQNLVVWDKGHAGLGMGFRAQHELMLHFTFGSPEYHDRSTGNVLQVGRVAADDREHQTQKPVDLLRRLVRVVAPDGGTVLDPFCGSGTTGVACVLERRRFLGVDRDIEHVATARRRIEETESPLRQGGLFVQAQEPGA
jgi:site-specific DNA-methyltransferase (adenine-specific)